MNQTRAQKIMQALRDKDKERLALLNQPVSKSTRGTTEKQEIYLKGSQSKDGNSFASHESPMNDCYEFGLDPSDPLDQLLEKSISSASSENSIWTNIFEEISTIDVDHLNTIPLTPLVPNSSSESSLNTAMTQLEDKPCNENSSQSPDLNNLPPTANNNKKISRTWDRKNYCLFCQTLVTNFSRHIVRWHKFEKEVMEYQNIVDVDLKERKRKREAITDELRRRGNFLYNSSRKLDEEVLPNRRVSSKLSVEVRKSNSLRYLTCRFCLGMFSKNTFYRHRQKCSVKPNRKLTDKDVAAVGIGDIVFGTHTKRAASKPDGIALFINSDETTMAMRERILNTLNKDELGLTAINDPLILKIGSQFFASHLAMKDEESVRKKLRDGARLLKKCMAKDETIKTFSDCFNPKKFNVVVEAVQELCGFDETIGTVKVVGMPARLSYIIQEGAKILVCEVITQEGITEHYKNKVKTEVDEFSHLLKAKWKYIISTNAEKSRKKAVSLKQKLLPDDGDIQIISSKIKELENEWSLKLRNEITTHNYEELCKATIAHIIVLNRRRAGEAARAGIEFYINRPPQDDLTEDVLAILTQEERNTLPTMTVFTVTGKTTPVPILLTITMKNNVDLIISCREALDIPRENPFLFARTCTDRPFDGPKIIRELKQTCSHLMKKPSDLTSRGLRNHLATKSQVLNSEKYTENVCQFLGHTKDVHKQNYRIPLQAVQRGQIAYRLLSMEGSSSDISVPSTSAGHTDPDPTIETTQQCATESGNEQEMYAETEEEEEEVEQQRNVTRKKQVVVRRRWTEEEKDVVLRNLGDYIIIGREPGMAECTNVIRKNRILQSRSWKQLNALIHNYITRKSKLPAKFSHLKSQQS